MLVYSDEWLDNFIIVQINDLTDKYEMILNLEDVIGSKPYNQEYLEKAIEKYNLTLVEKM